MQQRKLQREQNQQKEKIDFEMKKQNQINDTTKSESEEIIKDIADFETLLEMNRNDRNSHKVSILKVGALWDNCKAFPEDHRLTLNRFVLWHSSLLRIFGFFLRPRPKIHTSHQYLEDLH